MKKTLTLFALASVFTFVSINFSSCKKEEEEKKEENNTNTCSTVSYTANIKTIVDNNCVGCHGSSSPSAGISLVTYNNVKTAASTGKLMDAINHRNGAVAMPPTGSKMTQATLDLFDCWKTNSFKE